MSDIIDEGQILADMDFYEQEEEDYEDDYLDDDDNFFYEDFI